MPDYLILPRAREIRGTVRAPSSKSSTNRALVLAALSPTPVTLVRPLDCDDADALVASLRVMGARISASEGALEVSGPLRGGPEEIVLDARDSGTAARFLAAVAAATPGRFRLDGSPRLRERPMRGLLDALESAGVRVVPLGRRGSLPLEIEGGALRPSEVEVDGRESSQFLSALLLAGVAVEGGLAVRPTGTVVSAPYVALTVETLRAFGHSVETEGGAFRVRRGERAISSYEVPGDFSSAIALLAVAAAGARGSVTVRGVSRDSAAPDAAALDVLEAFGLEIAGEPGAVTATLASPPLSAVSVRASDFPDAVPVLAALAALAKGESRFSGIAHLRLKESDRIAALASLIPAAGARVRATDADLVVTGGARAGDGAILPTFRDHRIAMAAGIVSLALGGYRIENPGSVSKSYPAFFRDLATLSH